MLYTNTIFNFFLKYSIRIICMNCIIADFSCPVVSEEYEVYANPKDCSKYYVCHKGNANSLSCPDGFLFDAAEKRCGSLSYVKCA